MTFEEYVFDFYGKGDNHKRGHSLYGEEFFPSADGQDGGVTMAEIRLATKIRIIAQPDLPFDGDTIDRVIVRDILLGARNPT
jgi:hypothetical protein